MTTATETAYPVTSKSEYNEVGLTKRELAAIELRVPMSGDDQIDAMIRVANRRDAAAMAMQGLCTHVAPNYTTGECNAAIVDRAVVLADALIAELNKETP